MPNSKSFDRPLELSSFEFESIIFEARYSHAYLHWDRAGAIWTEANSKWPNLKMASVDPTKTAFTLPEGYLLTITLENMVCAAYHQDKDLDGYIDVLKDFVELTTRYLEISDFSRIGLRLTYFKEYPDQEAASKALLSTNLLRLPEGKQFGIDGNATHPEYAIRWESKNRGATVRIKAEGRKLDFEAPLNIKELKSVSILKNGLTVDVDYYTLATVSVGQFRAEDWVNNSQHLIKRGIGSFLEAGK